MRDEEFLMQCAFFDRVGISPFTRDLPIYAVPNFAGNYGNPKARLIAGARHKRSGRRAGVPDVCVDVAREGFHGMRIEFKTPTGTVAKEQKVWHSILREQGFKVIVCKSDVAAWDELCAYLGIANGRVIW